MVKILSIFLIAASSDKVYFLDLQSFSHFSMEVSRFCVYCPHTFPLYFLRTVDCVICYTRIASVPNDGIFPVLGNSWGDLEFCLPNVLGTTCTLNLVDTWQAVFGQSTFVWSCQNSIKIITRFKDRLQSCFLEIAFQFQTETCYLWKLYNFLSFQVLTAIYCYIGA